MLYLICIFLISVNTCPSDYSENFVVQGLDTNFRIIPDTFMECNYTDFSCYDALCNTFKKNNSHSSCISYVAFIPLSTYLNCSQMQSFVNTNMIVFGMHFVDNINFKIKITNNITACNTAGDCLMKGCSLYNSNYEIDWILFTGQCKNKTI